MVEKDYIDRYSLIKKVHTGMNIIEAMQAIIDAPAADVVEVVRCGECMFWDAPPSCEGLARCRTGESGVRFRNASDFCSRGERKGGEE